MSQPVSLKPAPVDVQKAWVRAKEEGQGQPASEELKDAYLEAKRSEYTGSGGPATSALSPVIKDVWVTSDGKTAVAHDDQGTVWAIDF